MADREKVIRGLKKCPFCGSATALVIDTVRGCEECNNFEDDVKCPAYEPYESDVDRCPYKAVICAVGRGGCGAGTGWKLSVTDAVDAWNRRANNG